MWLPTFKDGALSWIESGPNAVFAGTAYVRRSRRPSVCVCLTLWCGIMWKCTCLSKALTVGVIVFWKALWKPITVQSVWIIGFYHLLKVAHHDRKSSPGFVTLWARFKAGTPLSSRRETHASKKVRMVDVKKNRMQWLTYCLLPIFNWKQHMSRNAFVSLSTTVNRHRDELVVHTLQNSNAWILSPFYYFEFDTSNQKVVSEQIFLTLLPR